MSTDLAETTVIDHGARSRGRWFVPTIRTATIERWFWYLAILAMVADLVTTYVGLHIGMTEGNPIVRLAMAEIGFAGLAAVKVPGILCAVVLRLLFKQYRLVIPLGVAIPWTVAAGLNAMLIL